MTRGRKASCAWKAVLENAQARGLSVGQCAREQGRPYGTVSTAMKRLGIPLRTDDRKRRWDGIRTRDKANAKALNLQYFPQSTLSDLAQNERLAPFADVRVMVEPDVLYVVTEEGDAWCKIGISASNDIERRVRELRLGNPRRLRLVLKVETPSPRKTENSVHSKLWLKRAGGRVRTEWFAVSPEEAVRAVLEAVEQDKEESQKRCAP